MTGPGDEMAAVPTDRGPLRASHADREQAIDMLKAAFVQGRLAKDEFDARVGQVFASRTYAELAAVTDDIPAGAIESPVTAGGRPGAGRAARQNAPQNKRMRDHCGNRAFGRRLDRGVACPCR